LFVKSSLCSGRESVHTLTRGRTGRAGTAASPAVQQMALVTIRSRIWRLSGMRPSRSRAARRRPPRRSGASPGASTRRSGRYSSRKVVHALSAALISAQRGRTVPQLLVDALEPVLAAGRGFRFDHRSPEKPTIAMVANPSVQAATVVTSLPTTLSSLSSRGDHQVRFTASVSRGPPAWPARRRSRTTRTPRPRHSLVGGSRKAASSCAGASRTAAPSGELSTMRPATGPWPG